MSNEELEEELREAVKASQEIMREFIKDNMGTSSSEKDNSQRCDEIFKNVKFLIDYDKQFKNFVAYWDHDSLNMYTTTIENNQKRAFLIEIIIHEYAHVFSSELSTKENFYWVVEEAMANLFAESCINHWLQKGKDLPYVSQEENEKIKSEGYHNIHSYKEESQFVKSIFYLLKKRGNDLSMMQDYLMGIQPDFFSSCGVVLDDSSLFSQISSDMERVEKYAINTDEKSKQYFGKAQLELIHFLSKQEDLKEDSWRESSDFELDSLYGTESSVLMRAYLKKEHSIPTSVSSEKLSKIFDLQEIREFGNTDIISDICEDGITKEDFSKIIKAYHGFSFLRFEDMPAVQLGFAIGYINEFELNDEDRETFLKYLISKREDRLFSFPKFKEMLEKNGLLNESSISTEDRNYFFRGFLSECEAEFEILKFENEVEMSVNELRRMGFKDYEIEAMRIGNFDYETGIKITDRKSFVHDKARERINKLLKIFYVNGYNNNDILQMSNNDMWEMNIEEFKGIDIQLIKNEILRVKGKLPNKKDIIADVIADIKENGEIGITSVEKTSEIIKEEFVQNTTKNKDTRDTTSR